jgi:hypothetical protein
MTLGDYLVIGAAFVLLVILAYAAVGESLWGGRKQPRSTDYRLPRSWRPTRKEDR